MLALDIEASGTNFQKHSLLSVGAFDFDDPSNRFYMECRIFDGAHVMDQALEVNGFSQEDITDINKATESELITEFLDWSQSVKDRTLLGQNISFDREMLKAASDRAGCNWNLAYRSIDTHSLCYMHMIKRGITPPFNAEKRRSDLSLDDILSYCGIEAEPKPHNALTGALCHGEVASRLLYDEKLLPEFSSFEIPWLAS